MKSVIALRKKVICNGIQYNSLNLPVLYLFTDKNTETTFSININEKDIFAAIENKLHDIKKKYTKNI